MTHPFYQIAKHEDDDWEEFLERVYLIDIFLPVIKAYADRSTLKYVIRYIVYTYSLHSEKIVLGMEWHKNKQQIFDDVMAKPEKGIYEDLILLKNTAVLETVSRWLDHQDSDAFKQLSVLKDLRVEMQISSLGSIVKSTGEQDYDQKFKNAEYANKLKSMIKDLEAELVQKDNRMKDAVKEVKTAKNQFNVGPETFSK